MPEIVARNDRLAQLLILCKWDPHGFHHRLYDFQLAGLAEPHAVGRQLVAIATCLTSPS